MKVFSLLSLGGISQISIESGIGNYIHHLVWYCVHSAPCYTGVEYCLFDSRLCESPTQINESLHTFLMVASLWSRDHNTETMDCPTFCNELQEKAYVSPSCRMLALSIEHNLLASNLEPIDGGDDPDIDW